MSSTQRAIFFAVVGSEASYAALAQSIGISVAEIERELARALAALDAAGDG